MTIWNQNNSILDLVVVAGTAGFAVNCHVAKTENKIRMKKVPAAVQVCRPPCEIVIEKAGKD